MSILAKSEIEAEIRAGRIRIEPFDPAMIGPASVDLHLSDAFRVFVHLPTEIDINDELSFRAATKGLRLRGIMGWEAHAVAIADGNEKAAVVADAIGRLAATAQAIRDAGMACEIVSCGGTGTFPYCARQPGVTEIQAGGLIFSDELYRTKFGLTFPQALTILATVTSRPTADRVILDAGKKAMSSDAAPPRPVGVEAAKPVALSAEHTTVVLATPSDAPRVGEKMQFVVGYSDTTVHLHEKIHAIRGGRVTETWVVKARGKLS